jgi:tryptophan synthase alpha chain
MENRINQLVAKRGEVLSIYFTAGYPQLNDTATIVKSLSESGVDLIEIGLPFSDPLADGPTIQESSKIALENGMSTDMLFQQLEGIREYTNVPLITMGNLNPILQYGMERFCAQCQHTGIDGLILPDLPAEVYEQEYKALFEEYGLHLVLLITPETPEERIRYFDQLSNGFIYMVSSSSTTGAKQGFSLQQQGYFERIQDMKLKNATMIGFGIANNDSYKAANRFSNGAIIGSAFIRSLQPENLQQSITNFVTSIKD